MVGNVYYYEGKDGKIYVGRDIAIAARIVHNVELKTKEDLDEYVKLRCAGVVKEIKNVTVEDLIKKDEIVKATILYKEQNNCTLKEASEHVERLKDIYQKDEK
jgi:flagellar basal body-associated protein FliL